MGKTYIDTVKYIVYGDVHIDGIVEKPDVVGAVFGQTEGLLGDELDLRDLQKNGRIGRIEVDLNVKDGKTIGNIKIPSSLDMVETCIIAAALETVDRVGPCEADIKVGKVEDTRSVKRKQVINRAKILLKSLISEELPESREISDLVRANVKASEITQYGPDKLPSGPHIDRGEDIILVEGRADVICLLKSGITNSVALGGARVPPKSVIDLTRRKETTVFLDGDRGGDIILNELIQSGGEIDFIARAPRGKEVEELTRKEIIKCLRLKVHYEKEKKGQKISQSKFSYTSSNFKHTSQRENQGNHSTERSENYSRQRPSGGRYGTVAHNKSGSRVNSSKDASAGMTQTTTSRVASGVKSRVTTARGTYSRPTISRSRREEFIVKTPEVLLKELGKINNTLRSKFYNKKGVMTKEVPVKDMVKTLDELEDTDTIIFDGIITQRLVDLAAKRGVTTLVGLKIGNVSKAPPSIEIITRTN